MDEKIDLPRTPGANKPPDSSDGQTATAARPRCNVLGSDVEIKGKLICRQELRVDGRVEGEIHSAGGLTIGDRAEIRGDVTAKTVTVFGTVTGNITAAERCELKARASLEGDLKTARAIVEEGAGFIGNSFVQCWDAAQILQRIAESKSHEREAQPRALVS